MSNLKGSLFNYNAMNGNMKKHLSAVSLIPVILFLTACQLEDFIPATYISVSNLSLDKLTLNVDEYVEIVIPAQYAIFRATPGQQKVFTLKLGICVVDPVSGDCPIDAEPGQQIALPSTLRISPQSKGAFYSELTATSEVKTFEHKLKLTSTKAASYILKPFTLIDDTHANIIDRSTEITFK